MYLFRASLSITVVTTALVSGADPHGDAACVAGVSDPAVRPRPAQCAHPPAADDQAEDAQAHACPRGLPHRSKRDAAERGGRIVATANARSSSVLTRSRASPCQLGGAENVPARQVTAKGPAEDASTLDRRAASPAQWLRRGEIAIVRPEMGRAEQLADQFTATHREFYDFVKNATPEQWRAKGINHPEIRVGNEDEGRPVGTIATMSAMAI
jgi:hypothetical protein